MGHITVIARVARDLWQRKQTLSSGSALGLGSFTAINPWPRAITIIIKDRKLRKLIQKGPSYREQNNINWNTNLKNCIKAIKEYKTKWARREKVDTRVLNEWEGTITSIVKTRIERIRRKHKQSHRQYWKQDKAHLKYLSELHEEYVLVPAVKLVIMSW